MYLKKNISYIFSIEGKSQERLRTKDWKKVYNYKPNTKLAYTIVCK